MPKGEPPLQGSAVIVPVEIHTGSCSKNATLIPEILRLNFSPLMILVKLSSGDNNCSHYCRILNRILLLVADADLSKVDHP